MPVTTNTRKLAALLGASGAGIGTDGLMQSAGIDTDMATQTELDTVSTLATAAATSTDVGTIETNVTQLAFYRAADHTLVKYNLTDQVIDTYQDATGIDAANSTNETHDNSTKVWRSGGTSSVAGLAFRHIKVIVTLADFHDANAGIGMVNFDNGTGTAGDHQPLNAYDGKTTPPTAYNAANRDKTTISAWDESNESSFYWWVTQGSLNQWCWVDFGETKTGVTKIFIGKSRTNGDVRGIHIDISTTDTTTYSSIVWTAMPFEDASNAQMTYGTTTDGVAFSMNRHDSTTISMSAHGTNGNSGYSSIEGGTLWTHDVVAYNNLTLQSTSLATASSAPTKGDLVVQIEDVAGTSTVNTDIKGFVSRDGGTTFIEGTFVDEGTWGTNKRILAFHDLTFTGASGTDMRYKITTHNQVLAKQVEIHAAALSWS